MLQGRRRVLAFGAIKNTEVRCFLRLRVLAGCGRAWDQLSCVIVDRLPFAVPSDPIVAARVRALQDEGRNPFAEFQVAAGGTGVEQGFGRLIRAKTDRGVLALLDTRLQRMPYGKFPGVAAEVRDDA